MTGALGCIGAWTVRQLVREGVPVVAFDLGHDPRRIELIVEPDDLAAWTSSQGDITDLATVERALDEYGITNVIHLAALQVPFCRADPPLGAQVNVTGTVNVFEAVKRRGDGMAPVVYTGSIGMFSLSDVDPMTGRLEEDADAHPGNHYGVYKLANEGSARIYWADTGVPSVGLRPMTVYGAGRDQGMTSTPTARSRPPCSACRTRSASVVGPCSSTPRTWLRPWSLPVEALPMGLASSTSAAARWPSTSGWPPSKPPSRRRRG